MTTPTTLPPELARLREQAREEMQSREELKRRAEADRKRDAWSEVLRAATVDLGPLAQYVLWDYAQERFRVEYDDMTLELNLPETHPLRVRFVRPRMGGEWQRAATSPYLVDQPQNGVPYWIIMRPDGQILQTHTLGEALVLAQRDDAAAPPF